MHQHLHVGAGSRRANHCRSPRTAPGGDGNDGARHFCTTADDFHHYDDDNTADAGACFQRW